MLNFSFLAVFKKIGIQKCVCISTAWKGLNCTILSVYSEFKWHKERLNIINRRH
jgi:hypothetical protein